MTPGRGRQGPISVQPKVTGVAADPHLRAGSAAASGWSEGLNFESRTPFHGRATSSSGHRVAENGDAPGDHGKNRARGVTGFSPFTPLLGDIEGPHLTQVNQYHCSLIVI